jgi:lysophospholipase L1-like esterase
MKKIISALAFAAVCGCIVCQPMLAARKTSIPKAQREATEWTDIWLTSCTKADKPRVLLVGDSITKNYYNGVVKNLRSQAYVGRMATSLCAADPAYVPTLKAVLLQVKFDVIHFNNGLHGVGYTEEEYAKGYQEAIETIRKMQPEAKIIITLSTPLKKGSNKDNLNPRVDERNRIVSKIAKSIGAEIDDLNTPMRNHPEYHRDAYHYKGDAVGIQARLVAESIKAVLK